MIRSLGDALCIELAEADGRPEDHRDTSPDIPKMETGPYPGQVRTYRIEETETISDSILFDSITTKAYIDLHSRKRPKRKDGGNSGVERIGLLN
jgi:hypothetical protein